jgi:hypothetical protein
MPEVVEGVGAVGIGPEGSEQAERLLIAFDG